MKKLKQSTKFQLVRDGELYKKVYNHLYEAREEGQQLVGCGFISKFRAIPAKAVWLRG